MARPTKAQLTAFRDAARADFQITHTFGAYDFECNPTEGAYELAEKVIKAWSVRSSPGAFATMRSKLREQDVAA